MSIQTIHIDAWSKLEQKLNENTALGLAASGLVSVEPTATPGTWLVFSNSKVGVEQGDGWELRVAPKLDIPKLMFLLGYAINPKGWLDQTASFSDDVDLFSSMASGFASQARKALSPSPIQGYVAVNEQSPALRGRIRFGDQISKALPLPFEVSYDDFTINVPENRLLVAAAKLLLRFPRIPAPARTNLLRVVSTLDQVDPWVGPIPETQQSRLNERYVPALVLARLIIQNSSVTTHAGPHASSSFVFDMNRIFEDFLLISLTESLGSHGGKTVGQFNKMHLDHEANLRLIPDITWWLHGRAAAVIDAKYKRLVDARFPNADAYQMLAYCTRFNLDCGFLIYAHDQEHQQRDHRIRNADVTVRVRTIDVEKEPSILLEQVDSLAEEIVHSKLQQLDRTEQVC